MWSKIQFYDPFLFDKDIRSIIYEVRKKYGHDSVDYLGIRVTGKMIASPRFAMMKTKIMPLVLLEYGKYIERVNEHNT